MKDRSFALRFGGTVLIFALAPTVALAYIDPGNGAYMVQALFTLVGAALFYLRHPVRSIKAAWHSIASRWTSSNEASEAIAPLGADGAERAGETEVTP